MVDYCSDCMNTCEATCSRVCSSSCSSHCVYECISSCKGNSAEVIKQTAIEDAALMEMEREGPPGFICVKPDKKGYLRIPSTKKEMDKMIEEYRLQRLIDEGSLVEVYE